MKKKVCASVIAIHQGRILANGSVDHLRGMMNCPSLVDIFAELTEERDLEAVAKDIVGVL